MLCSMHMRTHLVFCNLVLGDQPGGIHANTVTTVDLDDNAEKFVKGALSYLKMRFGCLKNPPLSHFAALNLRKKANVNSGGSDESDSS